MKRVLIVILIWAIEMVSANDVHAQGAQLQVQALANVPIDTRMSEKIRNGNKADALAPKLQLRAIVSARDGAPFSTALEWLVFGRMVSDPRQAGGVAPELMLMQSSKEAILAKPIPGSAATFFAFTPGQIRNGVRSEGWLVRLLTVDGKLLDAKASDATLLAIGKDQARLTTLVAVKTQRDVENVELPLETAAKIKAAAETHWPGNPAMQEFEIKQMTEAHKAAIRK